MVDVTMKEEMCASSRLSLAINEEGHTLSMCKDIRGGIPYPKLQDAIRVSYRLMSFSLTFEKIHSTDGT